MERKNGWKNERKELNFQWKHCERPKEIALRWNCHSQINELTCWMEIRLSKAVDMQMGISESSLCHCSGQLPYEQLKSLESGCLQKIIWKVDVLNTSFHIVRVLALGNTQSKL